jgi:hypothetical protein
MSPQARMKVGTPAFVDCFSHFFYSLEEKAARMIYVEVEGSQGSKVGAWCFLTCFSSFHFFVFVGFREISHRQ